MKGGESYSQQSVGFEGEYVGSNMERLVTVIKRISRQKETES